MFNLSTKQTVWIAVVFSLVLWATRGQHVASLIGLPDATWAIAFVVGFLLSPALFLLVLAQAFVIDYLAMGDFIFNLAYVALIPSYLVLWMAGRWLRQHYEQNEFRISGAFYLQKSGASLVGFAELFGTYFFSNLFFTLCYIAVASLGFYLVTETAKKKLA
ncbi:MAG: hypothetical protein RLZZ325_1335 [Pseudomonadota bacterium]